MGCSASRPSLTTTTITTTVDHHDPPSISSTSSPFPFSDHHYTTSSSSNSTQTPVPRTMSLPTTLIHHPPLRKGDSSHFVSLTSTSYASLSSTHSFKPSDPHSVSVSSPDSVINTWELMEGLDEDFDMFLVNNNINNNNTNLKKDIEKEKPYVSFGLGGPYELVDYTEVKPLWKHLSEMGSNLISNSKRLDEHNLNLATYSVSKSPVLNNSKDCCLSGCEDRIVLYYTSLRGIRKTYENCCEIRMILKGFGVFVDERDISMDSSYKKELQGVFKGKGVSLPQVFIRGKHVGGADEIKRLHEDGELFGYMKGLRVMDPGFVCDHCGDARFVPCPKCSGSRKVFEEEEGRSVRCLDCNENGLIRCGSCCS